MGLVKGMKCHSQYKGEEHEHDNVDDRHFSPIVLDLRQHSRSARIASKAQLALMVIVGVAIRVCILTKRPCPIRCIQEQKVANSRGFATPRLQKTAQKKEGNKKLNTDNN